jgi:hypothetical protein
MIEEERPRLDVRGDRGRGVDQKIRDFQEDLWIFEEIFSRLVC